MWREEDASRQFVKGIENRRSTKANTKVTKGRPGKGLVAESGADRNTLAACSAAAAEHGGSALCLHAGPEAVSLNAVAAVGLKCALGHKRALLNLYAEI